MPDVDPTTTITDAGAALSVAHRLLAAAGNDPANPAHAYWRTIATAPLAALLYSASPVGNGAGMPWARQVLSHPGSQSTTAVDQVLATHSDDVSVLYLEAAWLRATTLAVGQASSVNAMMRTALNPSAVATA